MRRIYKFMCAICIALSLSLSIFGQKVASSAGVQFLGTDCRIDWTLGESAVQTFYSGPFIVTEGFHQPILLIAGIPDVGTSNSTIKVYPNPTRDILTISLSDKPPSKTTAKLYNALGSLISQNELKNNKSVISMTSLPDGIYSLTVTMGSSEIHQFKIIKSK